MQPDDFRVQVGLYERMGDLLRRLGDVPPGTRVLLQVPPRALVLRTLDDARLLRERQAQQQIDLIIASTDSAILAQARSYGFPVEDLRVPRRGGAAGAAGPSLAQGMFRGLGQPGQTPAAELPPRPAPPLAPPVAPPVAPSPPRDPGLVAPPVAPPVAPSPPHNLGLIESAPDPFRGLATTGRTPDFYVEPPPAPPPPPALPPFRAPARAPLPPHAVPVDAGQAAPPAAKLVAPAPPDNASPVPAPPALTPSAGSIPAPPSALAPELPVAVEPAVDPAGVTASPPVAALVGEAPPAPPVPPSPALPAASTVPAVEPPRSRPAPPGPTRPREANRTERAAVPAQPQIVPPGPPPVAHPGAPSVSEAAAPQAPAPAPEAPPARPRFGLGALRDALATRLSRESTSEPPAESAGPAPADLSVAPPAHPPIPAGRTPVRLPLDFAVDVSRRAGSAPRGVEYSTALERDETLEDLLERLELVKAGTTIRLHVPREAMALQTLEEYDMLEALQERRQVRLTVVSSSATVVGMAWLYGFEVSDLRSPRAPGAPAAASLPDEYVVDISRQERTADLLARLDGIPVAAQIEIHVPREGAALRTPEDYQLFRAARDWQPGQVRITSRDPRVVDLARIYDFDGEYTLEIGPQETTAYALKWLTTLPPGAACRLRVHRDTMALRRPADYKLLRSRQVAGQLQLTVVSRDLRVLGLATVHGLAVDNLRLRHRIPVGAPPAVRPSGEIAAEPEVASAPPDQDAVTVTGAPPAPAPAVGPPATPADAAPQATPDPTLDPDEAQICAYLRNHDSITRGQCERLLAVSRTQAKLRLQKMRERGILRLEGTGNNIRYVLATERRRPR